jgi:hypothetical protein
VDDLDRGSVVRPRGVRPDTCLWQLPDGSKVRVRTRDRDALRRDVAVYGRVYLVRPDGSEVYDRVAPLSAAARELDAQ